MNKRRVLVFPCGSEIGLEVHRAARFSRHFDLVGGSSTDDHGRFVFTNYHGSFPFADDPGFPAFLSRFVREQNIDVLYPTMDSILIACKNIEADLGCRVVGSPAETVRICGSKSRTYEALRGHVRVPAIHRQVNDIPAYPVFAKPDASYGSRGVRKLADRLQAEAHLRESPHCLLLEYLAGPEFTVDCLTDRHGQLLFAGPRPRSRIMNGISASTRTMDDKSRFLPIAQAINAALPMRGAWFFQVKENAVGELVLLEVAARLGGSSSVHRIQGVNFALLSLFIAFDEDVQVMTNPMDVAIDRALDVRARVSRSFQTVYVDLDDTLIVDGLVNAVLVAFLFDCLNRGKKLVLVTRHAADLDAILARHRLGGLFDETIHVQQGEPKSGFLNDRNAIFIDDSFAERRDVSERCGIPVFAPDAIDGLALDELS